MDDTVLALLSVFTSLHRVRFASNCDEAAVEDTSVGRGKKSKSDDVNSVSVAVELQLSLLPSKPPAAVMTAVVYVPAVEVRVTAMLDADGKVAWRRCCCRRQHCCCDRRWEEAQYR